MLKKTEKTPVEAVGTACLDVSEDVSSGEQAPRPSPLTSIISAKSPLRLAKTNKSIQRVPTIAVSRAFFMFFAAVRAEFWHKTVMYLRAVQKLAFRHRTEGQHVWSLDLSRHKRGFRCFFQSSVQICVICGQI